MKHEDSLQLVEAETDFQQRPRRFRFTNFSRVCIFKVKDDQELDVDWFIGS
jgi:hypothetical protein